MSRAAVTRAADTGPVRLFFGTFAISIAIQLAHEFAHMLTAIALGASGRMSLNEVRYSEDLSEAEFFAVTAAAPILMLVLAGFAAMSRSKWAISVLGIILLGRSLAALLTALGAPNDEAKRGAIIGIGPWPFFVLMLGVVGTLFVRRYQRELPGSRWTLVSFAAAVVCFAFIVVADDYMFRIWF